MTHKGIDVVRNSRAGRLCIGGNVVTFSPHLMQLSKQISSSTPRPIQTPIPAISPICSATSRATPPSITSSLRLTSLRLSTACRPSISRCPMPARPTCRRTGRRRREWGRSARSSIRSSPTTTRSTDWARISRSINTPSATYYWEGARTARSVSLNPRTDSTYFWCEVGGEDLVV